MHNDPNIKGASVKAEEEFKKQYPAVYNYLEGHKEKLSKRNKAVLGSGENHQKVSVGNSQF